MSEGIFEDYEGLAPAAPAIGRLAAARALPGLAIAVSSVLLLVWDLEVRSGERTRHATILAQDEKPTASPFGVLPQPPNFLLMDAVSPSELWRFGTLSPSLATATPPPPPVSGGFSAADPYGGLAELRTSVSPGSLALWSGLGAGFVAEEEPETPAIASIEPASPPLPPRRPTESAPVPNLKPAPAPSELQRPAGPDVPGFFTRLFGGTSAQNRAVASAAPETTTLGRTLRDNAILRNLTPSAPLGALARYDKFTAVYDIEARTLYLPNGTRIEAHSGYGDLKDDPKHVDVHARGATPPDIYELTMRESLFHGVQALRLKPIGPGEQFGRDGLLAHPYMLGEGGDSNGCVSVKDYDAFLQAYESGQVKKLAVVAKLD